MRERAGHGQGRSLHYRCACAFDPCIHTYIYLLSLSLVRVVRASSVCRAWREAAALSHTPASLVRVSVYLSAAFLHLVFRVRDLRKDRSPICCFWSCLYNDVKGGGRVSPRRCETSSIEYIVMRFDWGVCVCSGISSKCWCIRRESLWSFNVQVCVEKGRREGGWETLITKDENAVWFDRKGTRRPYCKLSKLRRIWLDSVYIDGPPRRPRYFKPRL